MRAADPGRGELGAERDNQQGAQARQTVNEPAEHIERSRIDPVGVLQPRQDGGVFGQPLKQCEQRRDRSLLPLAGAISTAGYRPSLGIDNKAARKGATSFVSNPERAIIASSLSSRAAAGSPPTKPAACQIWLDIG